MNYNMQGITETIPKLFVMLKSRKVEIKKNIKCWWLTGPLVSRKGQRNGKGTSRKNDKQVVTPVKKPKARPKPETKWFYCKGNGHWKWNCPRYLADKKDGIVNKGILHIHVIVVYFTSVYSNPSVFDTGSVPKSSNSKRELWYVSNVSIISEVFMLLYYPSWMFNGLYYALLYYFWD